MYSRRLKRLAFLLPVLFISAVWFAYTFLDPGIAFRQVWPFLTTLIVGAIVFTGWIFGLLEKREGLIQHRSDQLTALHQAALALTQELELDVVLQQVVDQARSLVGAQYGALGVLAPDGAVIEQFIVSGITPELRARIGPPPSGHGLLGVLSRNGEAIRVPEISSDPRSVGFPDHHPRMQSLLGVPIKFKEEVIGDLYLTNKLSATGQVDVFTDQDQYILEMFATQAAIAITNAQLYRQAQQLTRLQERERIGMDLHDGVIQSIYAVGLNLEGVQYQMEDERQGVKKTLSQAIEGLNIVIRDIRNYILDLRPQRFQGRDLTEGLHELARELRAHSFLSVDVVIDSASWQDISPAKAVELLHIVREALTNIRKHSRASQVHIELKDKPSALVLVVSDNGIGFDPDRSLSGKGDGLRNMHERAQAIGGDLKIVRRPSAGMQIEVEVPLA